MFGIEEDFKQLMEQVYGPLGKKEKEESDRMAKQLVDNAVKEVKMTELEKIKAEIKVLEKKVALLEEIEKTPIPKMNLIKDGSVFCVDYNNTTYYRQEYRHSSGWIKWWRENDEGGILTRVDDAETFRLLEKLFSADIAANPDGSLKFMFGPTLYDVIADWWDEIFVNGNPSGQNVESLVEQIKEWLPQPQSAAGSQSLGVEDMVTGWNDCLERIKSKLS